MLPIIGVIVGVALYTSAWIEITCSTFLAAAISVALYTSAWIEIDDWRFNCRAFGSRTLHECVD